MSECLFCDEPLPDGQAYCGPPCASALRSLHHAKEKPTIEAGDRLALDYQHRRETTSP